MTKGWFGHTVRMMLCMIWAFVWIWVGIILCFTLIGILAFPFLWWLGCAPATREMKNRHQRILRNKQQAQNKIALQEQVVYYQQPYQGQRWD